ncbi:MAG: SWIM zinc finger family protein [Methanoregula sp.]|jgi:predicted nucleic acid-binding Zn finger protein|uniref:SWIM zinc finger family protein n=1 Tax=Methanoregula sp. TaxID=2052170 RepID=UPI003D0F129A
MSDIWQHLSEKRVLDTALCEEIEAVFGSRGKKALAAIDANKIKKYLDFFVVEGKTARYIVDEDFCTCGDFMYRGRTCWHLLAVRIARVTGTFERVDSWYQDQLKTAPEQNLD